VLGLGRVIGPAVSVPRSAPGQQDPGALEVVEAFEDVARGRRHGLPSFGDLVGRERPGIGQLVEFDRLAPTRAGPKRRARGGRRPSVAVGRLGDGQTEPGGRERRERRGGRVASGDFDQARRRELRERGADDGRVAHVRERDEDAEVGREREEEAEFVGVEEDVGPIGGRGHGGLPETDGGRDITIL